MSDNSVGILGSIAAAQEEKINWQQKLFNDMLIKACHTTSSVLDGIRVNLKHGADVNARDEDSGVTPLIVAAQQNNRDLIGLLIEKGADKDLADNNGKIARDYATKELVVQFSL